MRSLKHVGAFFMTLMLCLMTPLVSAAASAETVPQVDVFQSAPIWVAVGLVTGSAAIVAVGMAAVNLTARDPESGEDKLFSADPSDNESFVAKLQAWARMKAKEKLFPVKEELKTAEKENEGLRDVIVGEILRIKKLTADKNEDGEAKLDAEEEKKYLEGLPADRLKMEFERLPGPEEIKMEAATKEGTSPDSDGDVYADLE